MEAYKVREALKFLLKKKSKSYQDLSDELDVSLSTVKRMLGTEALSLERLGKVLNWLDVDFADLQLVIDSLSKKDDYDFTMEQEEFLASDIRYYNYLDKIHLGMTPDEIKEKYNLTEIRNQKILLDLEKYDLIYVTQGGAVKSKCRTTWSSKGPLKKCLVKKVNEKMNAYFVEKQLKGDFDEENFKLGYNIIWMPKKTYHKFIEELEQVRVKYMAHADLERKAGLDDSLGVCYLGLSYDFLDNNEFPGKYSDHSFEIYNDIS